ncbi:hypothetical protein [Rubritalea tangerina]|uniref:hypothetical protein n=1 Tax=Rubritalea tangerina TaxID=430798 RepID=UPI003617C8A8
MGLISKPTPSFNSRSTPPDRVVHSGFALPENKQLAPAIFSQSLSRKIALTIVLFLVDDMGLMDTSQPFLAGKDGRLAKQPLNDFYRTPGMVRLAKTGTLFSCFYAIVCVRRRGRRF